MRTGKKDHSVFGRSTTWFAYKTLPSFDNFYKRPEGCCVCGKNIAYSQIKKGNISLVVAPVEDLFSPS